MADKKAPARKRKTITLIPRKGGRKERPAPDAVNPGK